jgi:hypothetical protein
MLDLVEVFWNARPHLQRLGIKVNANTLDPRADQLFADVRSEIGRPFPTRSRSCASPRAART